MSQPEQFRDEVSLVEGYRAEPLRGEVAPRMDDPRPTGEPAALGPTTGSALPSGNPLRAGTGNSSVETQRTTAPPGRALSGATTSGQDPSTMQRAMGIMKQAAPFLARLLPLIDGNIASAVGNLFAPRPHAPAAMHVDLAPVQNQVADLQLQQNELRSTVQEQTTALIRVQDQLERVREATDRNTLEQGELITDLKKMSRKVSLVAVAFSTLLALSVIMNLILYLHVKRVLP